MRDGLPANDVEAISQDSYGRMWFGTSDGLSVFDGKSFTNYTTADGLPHNFVSQIVPDARRSGTMWMIAGGAVCTYDGHRFKSYPLPVDIVHAIYADNSGTTWCGTNRGVFTIVDESIEQFHGEMLNKDVLGFAEGGQDIMWIAVDTALIHFTKHSNQFTYIDINKIPDEMKQSDILPRVRGEFRSMKVDADGTLWLTNSYSYLFQIVGTHIARERPLFHNTFIYDLSHNQVSSYGYDGISTIHKGDISAAPVVTTTVNNGLQENSVRSAYVDYEGNSWIGGRDLGVAKLSAGSVLKFPIGEVWAVHNVQFAAADQNDHIWFIAHDTLAEFWRDRHERWIQKQHNFSRAKHLFFRGARDYNYYAGVYADHENKLWLASLKGPAQVECFQIIHDTSAAWDQPSTLKLLKRFRLDDDFTDNLAVCFLVSRGGIFWISLWHKGIMRLNPNTSPMEYRVFGEADG
ncbi:MAG TPA: two-component regulator propeller domain-containing protein, partial [Saprospiraceae bacterium]|nr:two-component regulator propeller domain-containing protein [Saprospiraceae bacterium]